MARFHHGQLSVIDRLREPVRLAAGMTAEGQLSRDVEERAIACLERFGQRLKSMQPDKVRVVGTNALRTAHRKKDFISRARAAIGHPIEIVAGIEEARLIYAGVAQLSPATQGRRLVVDIGGGSTEMIIGESLAPLELASLQMGCVRFSEEFFPEARSTPKRMQRARMAARQQLEAVFGRFRRRGWDEALGSSGTVRAIAEALAEIEPDSKGIEADALQALVERVARCENQLELDIACLSRDRREVFAGGLAILAELFEMLGVERMQVAEGAMREGLLYDLAGRLDDSVDARERTVRAMQNRYHVDLEQAARIELTARQLLGQVAVNWRLDDELPGQLLSWAARLHEIGLDVAHSRFQHHGAYLLENADMPGFSREEQRLLATMVGNHRRKPAFSDLDQLLPEWRDRIVLLTILLRISVLLHRSRSVQPMPALQLEARTRGAVLRFPDRWLRAHPLTMADLVDEEKFLRGCDFRLQVFSGR